MPKAAYPTGLDAADFITAMGLAIPATLDLDTKAESEAEDWESRTGWFPFLNVEGDEEIILDNSEQGWGWGSGFGSFGGFGSWRSGVPIMDFECGVLSISQIVAGNQILLEGRDFVLLDRNAQRKKWPYTSMRVTNTWSSYGITAAEITIRAKCGFCHELPSNVWNAILGKIVADSAPQLQLATTGGSAGWKLGPASEQFATGDGSIRAVMADLMCQYNRTLEIYLRHTI